MKRLKPDKETQRAAAFLLLQWACTECARLVYIKPRASTVRRLSLAMQTAAIGEIMTEIDRAKAAACVLPTTKGA